MVASLAAFLKSVPLRLALLPQTGLAGSQWEKSVTTPLEGGLPLSGTTGLAQFISTGGSSVVVVVVADPPVPPVPPPLKEALSRTPPEAGTPPDPGMVPPDPPRDGRSSVTMETSAEPS